MALETLLVRTLVELAGTLVDDFDVVELLTLLTDLSFIDGSLTVDILDPEAGRRRS